ncbi:MAG TPA: hypothetical protein VHL31_11910 [Geminicoccus sp.]|uniref:hypothetical protein n=1 Tax=Geminicoccus sp. TaxID=2024832 RepID=UPI002E318E80|nr:hypothetical protein [Geminicoccus sp.]HEX2526985.1 hypothetical protein [Geminicoccus sp.]
MGLLELTITVGYLAAMCIYGYLCYVQGVMDRDRDGRLPAVQKALRFGDRFIEPAAPARRRAAEVRQLGR